jgi:hypothetical protein
MIVVSRGKWGERTYDTLKILGFDVELVKVDESLPPIIDNPSEYLPEFSGDIIFSYALHPDINLEVVKRGEEVVIVAGGSKYLPPKAYEIGKEKGVKVINHRICCMLCEKDVSPSSETLKKLVEMVGSPKLEIKVKDGIVKEVKVIRGAPCGSTWYMAENLKGAPVEEAPYRGALLVSYYPCRAPRGKRDGIHASAELHKNAIERGLKILK